MKKVTVGRMALTVLGAMTMAFGYASAQNAVITGTVLAEDGKPLRQAHVSLLRPDQTKPIATVVADASGSYSIATAEKGLMVLRFSGVGHKNYPVATLLSDTAKATIDVRLEPIAYRSSFDSIRVIGDFNGFAYDSGVALERTPDGRYSATFPSTAAALNYQLLGIAQDGAVSAPESDNYAFDGVGSYRSVAVPTNGMVTVTFDSTALPHSKAKAQAVVNDPRMQSVASIYTDIVRRREAYQRALTENREAGRTIYQFKYNWSKDISRLTRQLADQEDTLIRGMLYVSLLDLGTLGANADLSAPIAQAALATIPPTSPLWSINPKLMQLAIGRTGQSDSVYQEYIAQAIAGNPDPEVTSLLLYDGLTVAYTAKQTDRAQEYYNRLVTQYSSSRYAAMARVQFTMARAEDKRSQQ